MDFLPAPGTFVQVDFWSLRSYGLHSPVLPPPICHSEVRTRRGHSPTCPEGSRTLSPVSPISEHVSSGTHRARQGRCRGVGEDGGHSSQHTHCFRAGVRAQYNQTLSNLSKEAQYLEFHEEFPKSQDTMWAKQSMSKALGHQADSTECQEGPGLGEPPLSPMRAWDRVLCPRLGLR